MSKVFEKPENIIYVCCGSKCKKRGGKEISKRYKRLIKETGLQEKVEVIKTECTDNCKLAPVISFQPRNQWYVEVKQNEIDSLFEENILDGIKEKSL